MSEGGHLLGARTTIAARTDVLASALLRVSACAMIRAVGPNLWSPAGVGRGGSARAMLSPGK